MIDAHVSLSLHILHSNGTKTLITEGIPMTDDGYGGNVLLLIDKGVLENEKLYFDLTFLMEAY